MRGEERRRQVARGQSPRGHVVGPVGDDADERGEAEDLAHRLLRGLQVEKRVLLPHPRAGAGAKGVGLLPLAGEHLHRLGRGQRLLRDLVEGGHVVEQVAEPLAQRPSQPPLQDHRGHEHGRRDRRHGRMEERQRGEHGRQPDRRLERGRRDAGDEAGRALDVVEEPRGQVSGTAAMEELQRETVQVAVEGFLQVGDEGRRRARGQPRPQIGRRAAGEGGGEGGCGDAQGRRRRERRRRAPVDEGAEEQDQPQVGRGRGEEEGGGEGDQPGVASRHAQQPGVGAQG